MAKKYKKLSGKIQLKKTDHKVGDVLVEDGVEMDSPYISICDKLYNSDLIKWSVEIRYYTNKAKKANDSRNIIFQQEVLTDADIDAALNIYEPKSKNLNWEL